MALIKCEECGYEISSRAPACPHCGCPVTAISEVAPEATPIPDAWQQQGAATSQPTPPVAMPRPDVLTIKHFAWLAGGLSLLLLLIRTCSDPGDTSTKAVPPSASDPSVVLSSEIKALNEDTKRRKEENKTRWAKEMEDETATPKVRLSGARLLIKWFPASPEGQKAQGLLKGLTDAAASENIGSWRYSSHEEGMSGKATRYATVTSTNTINLDFPYSGSQHATLSFRRHPRWGNDVIFSIEQGQILCHSYGDCSIGLRFDDGKVIRLQGTPPSDSSTESIFIPAFNTFMKQLPKASKVKVEVQLYQSGSPVFEFDITNFKPEKFK